MTTTMTTKTTTHGRAAGRRRTVLAAAVAAVILTTGGGRAATAAEKLWTGAGGDGKWSNPANWAEVPVAAPAAGDTLSFSTYLPISAPTTTTNDLPSLVPFSGLVVGRTNYQLVGNPIRLDGDIRGVGVAPFNPVEINLGLALSGNRRVDFSGGGLNIGGVVSGDGYGLTVAGARGGTITLNGTAPNTYTGTTAVAVGRLTLDLSGLTNATDLVDPRSPLVLGSGTGGPASLRTTGKPTGTSRQSFVSTTVLPGAHTVEVVSSGGDGTTLNLAAIDRRPGGAVVFIPPAAGSIRTVTPAVNGILGGYAAMASSAAWATVTSAGDVVPYVHSAAEMGAGAFDLPAANVDVGPPNASPAAGRTVNTLRFAAVAGTTLALSGANALTGGGVLVTPGTGTSQIVGGTLAGSAGTDLVVRQQSANPFTIASAVVDNGGPTALTKVGGGVLTLAGDNAYTGPTYLLNGPVAVAAVSDRGVPGPLGASTADAGGLILSGGTLRYTGPTAATNRGLTLGEAEGTIDVTDPAASLTMTGTVAVPAPAGPSPAYLAKSGVGELKLGGATDNPNLSVVVTAGTLVLAKASGPTVHAVNTAVSVFPGAALRLGGTGGDQVADAAPVYVSGTVDLDGMSEAVGPFGGVAGGRVVNGRPGTAATLTTNTLPFDVNTGFPGVIADGAGVTSFAKAGPGDARLTGSNTYTGDTVVRAGVLWLGNGGSGGSIAPASRVTGDAGAVLAFDRSADNSFPNRIDGGLGLLVLRSNVRLSPGNTFAGPVTTTSNGSLTVTAADALGVGPKTVSVGSTTAGAGLRLDGGNGDIALPADFRLSLSGVLRNDAGRNAVAGPIYVNGGGAVAVEGGSLTLAGPVSTDNAGARTLALRGAGDGRAAGVLADGPAAALSVAKDGGAGTWYLDAANTYTGSTAVTAGTLDASAGSIAASAGPMSVTGTGSRLIAKRIAPASLTVGAGAKVTLTNVDSAAGGTPGTAGRSNVGSLGNAGLLDVGGTGVVIASAVEAAVRSQIVGGRGGAGGAATWAGTLGITSSSAAAAPGTRAVGYRFAAGAATVAFTVLGDADLSGTVGIDDLSALAQNYNQSGRGWAQGDFNYDGTVGIDDLSALAQNYNASLGGGAAPGSGSAVALAAFARDYEAVFGEPLPAAGVPEPAAAGLVGAAAIGLVARRRRRAVGR